MIDNLEIKGTCDDTKDFLSMKRGAKLISEKIARIKEPKEKEEYSVANWIKMDYVERLGRGPLTPQ